MNDDLSDFDIGGQADDDAYYNWLKEKVIGSVGKWKIENRKDPENFDSFMGIDNIVNAITQINSQADVLQVTSSFLDMGVSVRDYVINHIDTIDQILTLMRDEKDPNSGNAKFIQGDRIKAEKFIKALKETKDPEYLENGKTARLSEVKDIASEQPLGTPPSEIVPLIPSNQPRNLKPPKSIDKKVEDHSNYKLPALVGAGIILTLVAAYIISLFSTTNNDYQKIIDAFDDHKQKISATYVSKEDYKPITSVPDLDNKLETEVNKAVKPIIEKQEEQKQESDKRYEEQNTAIADLTKTVEESNQKQEEYHKQGEEKDKKDSEYQKQQTEYQQNQIEKMRKISEQLKNNNKDKEIKEIKNSVENLDKKVDKEIKKLKEISKTVASAPVKQDVQVKKKPEKKSLFYTNWSITAKKINDSSIEVDYSPTSSKEYDLSRKLFGLSGDIGSQPLYFSFDFNALQGKIKGKDTLRGDNNNYTLTAGVGGSYGSDNNTNIFTWTAKSLFRQTDSETDGLPDYFSNEQEGDQSGYVIDVRMDRLANGTSFWITYENAKGKTKSTTTHPIFDPYIAKFDTKTTNTTIGVETSIFRFDMSKDSEGAFGAGIQYTWGTGEFNKTDFTNKTLDAFLFLDLFEKDKKRSFKWRLVGGVLFEDVNNKGFPDQDNENPTGYVGLRGDF